MLLQLPRPTLCQETQLLCPHFCTYEPVSLFVMCHCMKASTACRQKFPPRRDPLWRTTLFKKYQSAWVRALLCQISPYRKERAPITLPESTRNFSKQLRRKTKHLSIYLTYIHIIMYDIYLSRYIISNINNYIQRIIKLFSFAWCTLYLRYTSNINSITYIHRRNGSFKSLALHGIDTWSILLCTYMPNK